MIVLTVDELSFISSFTEDPILVPSPAMAVQFLPSEERRQLQWHLLRSRSLQFSNVMCSCKYGIVIGAVR